jgi:hypothetical protein
MEYTSTHLTAAGCLINELEGVSLSRWHYREYFHGKFSVELYLGGCDTVKISYGSDGCYTLTVVMVEVKRGKTSSKKGKFDGLPSHLQERMARIAARVIEYRKSIGKQPSILFEAAELVKQFTNL